MLTLLAQLACVAPACMAAGRRGRTTASAVLGVRDVFTTALWSVFGRRNPVALPLQRGINVSLAFLCPSAPLGVLLWATFVTRCTSAASLHLSCKICFFLFMNERTRQAFLLLHSSCFKQAHFKRGLPARTVWKGLWDKQEFSCGACESVRSKQPGVGGARSRACKLPHLMCVQPPLWANLASRAACE